MPASPPGRRTYKHTYVVPPPPPPLQKVFPGRTYVASFTPIRAKLPTYLRTHSGSCVLACVLLRTCIRTNVPPCYDMLTYPPRQSGAPASQWPAAMQWAISMQIREKLPVEGPNIPPFHAKVWFRSKRYVRYYVLTYVLMCVDTYLHTYLL